MKVKVSQIRDIVTESVKRILSEIHYKTLDNATNQSKGGRSRRFSKYRDDEFNSRFGYNTDKFEGFDEGDGFVKMVDGVLRGGEMGGFERCAHGRRKHQTFSRNMDDDGNYHHFEHNCCDTYGQTKQPKFHSRKIARKFADAANELGRMRNAAFVDGKGWQPDPDYKNIDWHEFWDEDDWK